MAGSLEQRWLETSAAQRERPPSKVTMFASFGEHPPLSDEELFALAHMAVEESQEGFPEHLRHAFSACRHGFGESVPPSIAVGLIPSWIGGPSDFLVAADGDGPYDLDTWARLHCPKLLALPALLDQGVSEAICGMAVDMYLDGKVRRSTDTAARALLMQYALRFGLRRMLSEFHAGGPARDRWADAAGHLAQQHGLVHFLRSRISCGCLGTVAPACVGTRVRLVDLDGPDKLSGKTGVVIEPGCEY